MTARRYGNAAQPDTRARIVRAADDLFYRQGFENTSFADIAGAVNLSRGNFYHHFKSKDEILEAVIAARIAYTSSMIERWEAAASDPRDRIITFVDILIRNKGQILRYGCPVGTLCAELAKLQHSCLSEANQLFELFRTWLARQFDLLGLEKDSSVFAMQLLARTQGVAVLSNAFNDEVFIHSEVQEMHAWVDQKVANRGRAHH